MTKMIRQKNNLIYCLYFVLYFFVLFLTYHDVVILESLHHLDNSNFASFIVFFFGWIIFFILLAANILVSKYSFILALRCGVLAYLPIVASFFITLDYTYSGIMNLSPFFYICIFIILSLVNLLIYTSINVITKTDKARIKKTVLNLGTRFTRLEISDISEKTGLNIKKVEEVVIKMIKNDEIYAAYKKNTQIVQFNQEANLEEIDKLLQFYENWEKDSINKKK